MMSGEVYMPLRPLASFSSESRSHLSSPNDHPRKTHSPAGWGGRDRGLRTGGAGRDMAEVRRVGRCGARLWGVLAP